MCFALRTGALMILALTSIEGSAVASTFDSWTLTFNSPSNYLASGPSVSTTPGSNAVGISFSNTVFAPGTTIPNFQTSSCGGGGACPATFYYSQPLQFTVDSPSVNVIAGHDYSIQFNIVQSNFSSGANQYVQVPNVTFEYVSSNPAVTGCGSCALALVPSTSGLFSVDFVPTISGNIEFGFDFSTGRNPNGAASWSTTAFTESGQYLFSNFSTVDLSAPPFVAATPLPASWTLMLLGLVVFGVLTLNRRRGILRKSRPANQSA